MASTHKRGGAWNPSDGSAEKDDGEHCFLDSTESHIRDKALGVSVRSSVESCSSAQGLGFAPNKEKAG